MKTICFYHNKDMDGYCSGAIVKKAIPDVELRGWDYKDPVPDFIGLEGNRVILIDITFPLKDIERLIEICELTIIDHHISFYKEAREKYGEFAPFEYIYEEGKAACVLGWGYFFTDVDLPLAVDWIGDYDIFKSEGSIMWHSHILPFKSYMYSVCDSPENFPVELFKNKVRLLDSALKEGKAILRAEKNSDKVASRRAFEKEVFGGYKALCVNHFPFSSNTLDSVVQDHHEILIGFYYTGDGWGVSLRRNKDDIDLSEIAKERGGGGHVSASGFHVENFKDIFV